MCYGPPSDRNKPVAHLCAKATAGVRSGMQGPRGRPAPKPLWRIASDRCRAISVGQPSVETNSRHATTWRATFIRQRASEYAAHKICNSNMALTSPAAHALKIACRQNRCADKSLRRARAAPFYLASPRPRPPPVPLPCKRPRPAHCGTRKIPANFRLTRC